MQPQIVYGSYISIYKATFVSVGLDILKILTHVTSFIGPQKSCLQNHMRFVISLNCDLELDITMSTSWKIDVLDDLTPDYHPVLILAG